MIYNKDNRFSESSSPHSLGLRNNVTIPNPGWDQNALLINSKKDWGTQGTYGMAQLKGLGGLTFDGTGLFGTGLFSGDVTTWGVPELITGIIGVYAIYTMFLETKHVKRDVTERLGARAKVRRVSRAAKLRKQAEELESKEGGWF
jgi:hypothetical protein